MSKEKIKVYLYTRVSTTMQIDGYSLDAQKTKMKALKMKQTGFRWQNSMLIGVKNSMML